MIYKVFIRYHTFDGARLPVDYVVFPPFSSKKMNHNEIPPSWAWPEAYLEERIGLERGDPHRSSMTNGGEDLSTGFD